MISKVFCHYAIPLEISESIRATFKSKLWRMGRLFSKLGGTKRKQQLLKWENGRESVWNFEVNEVEVNRQLLKRKRVVERHLNDEVVKRKKIEAEVKSLRKTTKKQAKVISHLKTCRSETGRGSSSKSWEKYSRQQQYNNKKTLASSVSGALSFCNDEGFKPCSLALENIDTGTVEVLNLSSGLFTAKQCASESMSASTKVHSALLIKEYQTMLFMN